MGSFDGSCERQTETWRDDTYLLVICIYSIIHCLSFMDQQVESVDLGQLSLLSCKGAKSAWPLVVRIYRPSNTHITTYCLIRLAIRVHTSRNQIHLDSSGLADWTGNRSAQMPRLLKERGDPSDGNGIDPIWLAVAIILPVLLTMVLFCCYLACGKKKRKIPEACVRTSDPTSQVSHN